MANSVVFPRAQFFSNSGRPLVGGRIHTYVAGSSTRARTYQDAANVQINTNPIILDARGEAAIYLAEGVEYKFVVEDSTGALIMTQEPVYGAIWPNAAEWPSDATLSYQYMTDARAAASATGPIKFYGTKAQADAAIGTLANGDIIEVSQDETRAGARTRYKVQAGALVFVVNLDQTRLDLANATDPAKGAGMVGYMPTGTGAVATNLEARLRAGFLSFVGDFEGVPDGTFVPGGAASGTDNLTKINVALAACSVLKKSLHVSGHFYCSGGFIIPRDVMVFGDGTPHTPLLIEIGQATGTALFINGAAGLDCVKFEENAGHTQLKDIAVYNTNTNAIRSVLAVIGQLYPVLDNVEIASLRPTTGAGLLIQSSAVAPAYSTLWGDFFKVRVQIGQLGTANEYSVATGLKLYAADTTHTPNTNCFYGGDIQGSISALDIDGAVSLSGPLGTQFFGTRFETSYVAGVTKTFADKATNVIGYGTTSVYTYPLLSIKKAFSTAFHGCYFEAAGFPATYDDGVNGVWPLLPVLSLTNAGEVRDTAFYNCNYNGCYVLDSGVRTHVSPTLSGHKYSTEIATAVVMRKNAAQSIPAYVFTSVSLQSAFRGNDDYLLWDAGTNKAIIRSKGAYLIHAQVMFDAGWVAAGTYAQCQVLAGGDGFLGSVVAASPTATPMVTQVHGLIDLNVGDTVELQVIQTQGVAQNTSASPAATFMCISKI